MKGGCDYVRFLHLRCDDVMEGEGEIDERNRLKNQIKGRNDSSDGAEAVYPGSRLDAPHKQPSEEDRNHQEHAQKHMVRYGPAESRKREQSIGTHKGAGDTIYNLNTVSSENTVQVRVDNLDIRKLTRINSASAGDIFNDQRENHPQEKSGEVLGIRHLLPRISLYEAANI